VTIVLTPIPLAGHPDDALLGGGHVLRHLGLRTRADVRGTAFGLTSLSDPEARNAFIHTARSIMDHSGQRVSALDRLYLAEGMPTLIIWGDRDPMIPLKHGLAAHKSIPHSRLEIFPDSGHYPFNEDPERFVAVLRDFLATTEPSRYDEEDIRRRLRDGAAAA